MNETMMPTPIDVATDALLPLADYVARTGKTRRTVERWLEAGELPGATQDGDGRWWVPAGAVRVAPPAVAKRVARQAAKAAASYDVVPATAASASPDLGHGGSLEEFADAIGFSRGGVRRLYRDMQAHPGLPFYVGRYGATTALKVYAPPR